MKTEHEDTAQPRLPGEAGQVRDQEHEHPRFELPRAKPEDFALSAEDATPAQPSLFGEL